MGDLKGEGNAALGTRGFVNNALRCTGGFIKQFACCSAGERTEGPEALSEQKGPEQERSKQRKRRRDPP